MDTYQKYNKKMLQEIMSKRDETATFWSRAIASTNSVRVGRVDYIHAIATDNNGQSEG